MVGASASPSTFPTNYGASGTVVGVGIENGLNYFDLRFSGTASLTSVDLFFPETTTGIPALTGQVWSQSVYLKFVSGTDLPNSNQITALMFELNSSGVFVASAGANNSTITSTLTRYNLTATLAGGASTAFVRPIYRFPATIGQFYDFTIRVAAPQMEVGGFASTWIPTSGATATRIADSFSRPNIFTNNLVTSSGGTWFLEFRVTSISRDNGNSIRIGDSSSAFSIVAGISAYSFILSKIIGGAATNIYFSFLGTNAFVKVAIKWNGTTADVFANGTKVVSATAFTPTNLPDLIGSFGTPIFIEQMALWGTPLTDAQCQEITL
jgi:hypothetical protein